MKTADELVLAISNSGESEELTAILPTLRRLQVVLVALTGGVQSALARHADLVLDTSVAQEACPLNLAPTASTTAQLAMGDALAVAPAGGARFQTRRLCPFAPRRRAGTQVAHAGSRRHAPR
jgi:arabinose-5-phosphate isomerase